MSVRMLDAVKEECNWITARVKYSLRELIIHMN